MSKLLEPVTIRGVTMRNRAVLSPMCQYSARHGVANDWHFAHLARFAMGGFGTVIVEATGVVPEGRITYGCLGLWDDAQVGPLARIASFLAAEVAVPGIQLGHAGRKASTALWYRGAFDETPEERMAGAFEEWEPLAPSALMHAAEPGPSGFKRPRAMSAAEIEALPGQFAAAARRALRAGFKFVELHMAHGYLLNQFLSPLANHRTDEWGGSRENRMRLPLAVVREVRSVWPEDLPLAVRISTVDAVEGGVTVEDSIALARALKAEGVDVVTCSSGGFDGARFSVGPGYQVAHARAVREGAGIATMAVGLLGAPEEAEAVIAEGAADFVALGRPALDNPNWPLHARFALGGCEDPYGEWPKQEGFAIRNMDRALKARMFQS
ncbi:MAG TPA: NADH:flavin oxidoreductase / NADH oxidase [Rhodobacteraceae bacterium]|nr:NADH:flavin oxidoreductase / NADH oxidase [Paracoccaceae bacterium]